jgi:Spy/CpxP family protein refolding chaperone
MKQKLFKFAFIFSVTFNAVFIGTAVYGAYFSGRATGGSPIDTMPIYQMLNLSEEQKKILRSRHEETQKMLAEKRRPFMTKWVEALKLVTEPDTDWAAVRAKQEEILQLHREAQTLLFERYNVSKDFFTPQQREMFWKEMRRLAESGELFKEPQDPQQAWPPRSVQLER